MVKNSLQLEISKYISKANKVLSKGSYQEAYKAYEEALQIFCRNISYNDSVSHFYEACILSLQGLTKMHLCEYQQAENLLEKSLILSPQNCITLLRRAKLNVQKCKKQLKTQEICQAIEDISKANLQMPQNQQIETLILNTEQLINSIEEQQQRNRVKEFFNNTLNCDQQEQVELDAQQMLSFSNLREIDKQSNSSCQRNIQKKLSILSINRLQSQEIQGQDTKQQNQIQIINKKNKVRGIRSNFRTYSNASVNIEQPKMKKRASQVNFQFQQSQQIEQVQNVDTQVPKLQKRKSCLRNSKIPNIIADNSVPKLHKRNSSFMNLKAIDKPMLTHSTQEQENICPRPDQANQNDTDSESQQNQFNIHGKQDCQHITRALKCLSNLNDSNKGVQQPGLKKKQSILKKNSIIGSHTQMRKSVSFTNSQIR